MSRLLKSALWLALLLGVIWLIIIIWWQYTHRIPTATDIVLYMLGLPLALLLGYWALKNSFNAIKLAAAIPPAAAQGKTTHLPNASVNELSGKERGYSVQLLASSVLLPIGSNAAEAISAMQDGKRPDLDKELTDADGFPVFAGRIADIATEQFLEVFDPPPAIPEYPLDQWPITVIRGLLILHQVVEELSSKASEHSEAHPAPATGVSTNLKPKSDVPLLTLRISLILPESWQLEIRAWVASWFKVHFEVQKIWTAGPIIVNQISSHLPTTALTLIDQLNLSVNRDELRDLCIVASCDSSVSQEMTDAWSQDNRLFSSKQQNGLVPGEGAAGVLFTSKKSAAGFEIDKSVEIRRLASARRDKSIDANGKISTALLEQLAEQALIVGNVELGKVTAVVSDIDHRANRHHEITAITSKLEALDLSTDSLAVNMANGHVGIASGLICLALGHQLAQDKDNAVLLLSASDAHERAALVILPVSAPSETTLTAAA
jgi:hypothetical protein